MQFTGQAKTQDPSLQHDWVITCGIKELAVGYAAGAATRCWRCGSLRERDGLPLILHSRHIRRAERVSIRPVSCASIRTSPNMSLSHLRDSGDRKNSSFLTERGMSNSRQNDLGGTTIARHNAFIVSGRYSAVQNRCLLVNSGSRLCKNSWANEMCRASSAT